MATKEKSKTLKVVSVEVTTGGSRGEVTLESLLPNLSNQIEHLQSPEARNTAIEAAAEGGMLGRPGLTRTAFPFPIDADGNEIGGNDEKPAKVAAYRITYKLLTR